MGRDLAGTAAQGMIDRSVQGLDPDGTPWRANATDYALYKATRYGVVNRPGELGGQMLSLESMMGATDVQAERVEMTYGTGDPPPENSRTGVPLRDSEKTATDREKASYFTDSGRRFYEFDDAIAGEVITRAAEAFDAYLDEETR